MTYVTRKFTYGQIPQLLMTIGKVIELVENSYLKLSTRTIEKINKIKEEAIKLYKIVDEQTKDLHELMVLHHEFMSILKTIGNRGKYDKSLVEKIKELQTRIKEEYDKIGGYDRVRELQEFAKQQIDLKFEPLSKKEIMDPIDNNYDNFPNNLTITFRDFEILKQLLENK